MLTGVPHLCTSLYVTIKVHILDFFDRYMKPILLQEPTRKKKRRKEKKKKRKKKEMRGGYTNVD